MDCSTKAVYGDVLFFSTTLPWWWWSAGLQHRCHISWHV